MIIDSKLKNFIQQYKYLIKENNFTELYQVWRILKNGKTVHLTTLLYSAGVNPLLYMTTVPSNFLYGAGLRKDSNFQLILEGDTFIIPNGVKEIRDDAFSYLEDVKCIQIPTSVETIEGTAFSHMYDLEYIEYEGTKEQWKKIYKDEDVWNLDSGNLSIVECNDGDIIL